jgi:signal transduction histidine kinase
MPEIPSPSDVVPISWIRTIVECDIPESAPLEGLVELCRTAASAIGAAAMSVHESDGPDGIRAEWASDADAAARLSHPSEWTVAATGPLAVVATAVPLDGAAPTSAQTVALGVVAGRAADAIRTARLRADLDGTLARMLESDERLVGRIGLDIHDGPTQHLSVGLLEIQLLQAQLSDVAASGVVLPDGLESAVERIYETLGGALTEMRELIGYLRPVRFQGRRLDEILTDVVVSFESRSGIDVDFRAENEFAVDGVSVTQRITFYRILQEALSNAQRHGQATEIHVRLSEDDTGTRLVVVDNGSGFDPAPFSQPVPGSSIARFGLLGMRDRTTMLGGGFDIASAPGEGCSLTIFLPRWTPPDTDESGS